MEIIMETPRLIVAKIEKEDSGTLFQLTGSSQVMHFFPKILSRQENMQMVEKILDQYQKYGHCFWKLLDKSGTAFIGMAGLLHQEIDGQAETEISYRILPRYWTRGFATEAARACRAYAEERLHKNSLISIIHPENTASRKVAEKLGAVKGPVTQFLGVPHVVYIYPLSACLCDER